MAKEEKETAEKQETKETQHVRTESGGDILERTEAFYQRYKNVINIASIAVVVIIGGLAIYKFAYLDPRENDAKEAFTMALFEFEEGNYEAAINDAPDRIGMYKVADKYSGTEAGELALYSVGISYLNMGEYQKAYAALEEVDLPDDEVVLNSIRFGAMGDALMELGKVDNAIEMYQEAIDHNTDEYTAPHYLMKQAVAYESKGNWSSALKNYEKIRDDYPESKEAGMNQDNIKKYIARAEYNTK